ncbi:universal stress protein [Parasediminibacterium sp. JCM 36343]|uniref:universal stress protein n=1 Tax=Parasediminibacterium sp. JCM 36343 TaxID=3374279 RepID=UPI00397BAB2F
MKDIKRILVAIDNEPSGEKVFTAAMQIVPRLHAEVAIVSVTEFDDIIGEARSEAAVVSETSSSDSTVTDTIRANIVKRHQHLIDVLGNNYAVTTFIEEGVPYEAILKVASEWGADLIVMGTHGRQGLEHLFMGSVAEKVVRHSTIPMLIIPTKPLF